MAAWEDAATRPELALAGMVFLSTAVAWEGAVAPVAARGESSVTGSTAATPETAA
jgi:hypothetical protein